MKFSHELTVLLKRLEIQRQRILNESKQPDQSDIPLSFHDSDFYFILLRRVYRKLKESAEIKTVADILEKNKVFLNKIRIRDHFDKAETSRKIEEISIKRIPKGFITGDGKVKVVTSVLANAADLFVVSGKYVWSLNKDHSKLLRLVEKVIELP